MVTEIPFFGPLEIMLPGGQEIIRTPLIVVHPRAPLGDYILSLTDEVIDEDSFRVTVVESNASGVIGQESFILKGW